MTSETQTQLLRDEAVEPTLEVIKDAIGDNLFVLYEQVLNVIEDEHRMEIQWRYYRDGKAWLCKVTYKKKTVLWLSLWENLIKTGFYFTEKTRAGVLELGIDQEIIEKFSNANPIGKLIPLILDINDKKLLPDFKKIISYKKELKS